MMSAQVVREDRVRGRYVELLARSGGVCRSSGPSGGHTDQVRKTGESWFDPAWPGASNPVTHEDDRELTDAG